jgi:hypothetical protein
LPASWDQCKYLKKEVTTSAVDFSCKLANGVNNIFKKSLNGAKGIIQGEDKSKTELKIS